MPSSDLFLSLLISLLRLALFSRTGRALMEVSLSLSLFAGEEGKHFVERSLLRILIRHPNRLFIPERRTVYAVSFAAVCVLRYP